MPDNQTTELPTWLHLSMEVSDGAPLNPIERFIYDNEPAGNSAYEWREQLRKMIDWVKAGMTDKTTDGPEFNPYDDNEERMVRLRHRPETASADDVRYLLNQLDYMRAQYDAAFWAAV